MFWRRTAGGVYHVGPVIWQFNNRSSWWVHTRYFTVSVYRATFGRGPHTLKIEWSSL